MVDDPHGNRGEEDIISRAVERDVRIAADTADTVSASHKGDCVGFVLNCDEVVVGTSTATLRRPLPPVLRQSFSEIGVRRWAEGVIPPNEVAPSCRIKRNPRQFPTKSTPTKVCPLRITTQSPTACLTSHVRLMFDRVGEPSRKRPSALALHSIQIRRANPECLGSEGMMPYVVPRITN